MHIHHPLGWPLARRRGQSSVSLHRACPGRRRCLWRIAWLVTLVALVVLLWRPVVVKIGSSLYTLIDTLIVVFVVVVVTAVVSCNVV
jgi:hypothetical protein